MYGLGMAPPSNSDQEKYYIFTSASLSTFICDCYWEGATPDVWYIQPTMNVLISITVVGK